MLRLPTAAILKAVLLGWLLLVTEMRDHYYFFEQLCDNSEYIILLFQEESLKWNRKKRVDQREPFTIFKSNQGDSDGIKAVNNLISISKVLRFC